jgi:hypothetical protein
VLDIAASLPVLEIGLQWAHTTEALEHLPAMARALEQGAISWSALRELTRVAAPETERMWLETAHGKTVRQLEDLVAGKVQGDTPASPADPSLRARARTGPQRLLQIESRS